MVIYSTVQDVLEFPPDLCRTPYSSAGVYPPVLRSQIQQLIHVWRREIHQAMRGSDFKQPPPFQTHILKHKHPFLPLPATLTSDQKTEDLYHLTAQGVI